jgi:hypothetical protein
MFMPLHRQSRWGDMLRDTRKAAAAMPAKVPASETVTAKPAMRSRAERELVKNWINGPPQSVKSEVSNPRALAQQIIAAGEKRRGNGKFHVIPDASTVAGQVVRAGMRRRSEEVPE